MVNSFIVSGRIYCCGGVPGGIEYLFLVVFHITYIKVNNQNLSDMSIMLLPFPTWYL